MNARTRISATLISAVCALSVGATGVAQAQAATDHRAAAAQAEQVTQQQIDEVASYLEAVDRGEHLGADGTFDHAVTEAKLGAEFADAFQHYLGLAAGGDASAPEGAQYGSYNMCLLNAIGVGGITGIVDKVKYHIEKKNWRKVAEIGLKEAAKRGIKIAGKGGVVGMAAALAVAAVTCIWAKAPEAEADAPAADVPSFAGRDAASLGLAG